MFLLHFLLCFHPYLRRRPPIQNGYYCQRHAQYLKVLVGRRLQLTGGAGGNKTEQEQTLRDHAADWTGGLASRALELTGR